MIVIMDIDGVLADSAHRRHYILNADGSRKDKPDWDSFFKECVHDPLIKEGARLLETFLYEYGDVVFLTGRSEKYREHTTRWLRLNFRNLGKSEVIMRQQHDHRPDYTYKRDELLAQQNEYPSATFLLIDDSLANVNEAVKLGITALHFRRPESGITQETVMNVIHETFGKPVTV